VHDAFDLSLAKSRGERLELCDVADDQLETPLEIREQRVVDAVLEDDRRVAALEQLAGDPRAVDSNPTGD
jgi:hypothetical protein